MQEAPDSDITGLLMAWGDGDRQALDHLMPVVHGRLRRLAASYLRRERRDHTLQTLALVNELYLKLIGHRGTEWHDSAHFFALAARMMRRILVDHARNHGYAKRGGGWRKLQVEALAELDPLRLDRPADLLALDDALRDLARQDPQMAQLVELRFFGGLNKHELGEVLGLSSATVTRRWRVLKAWLYRYLVDGETVEL